MAKKAAGNKRTKSVRKKAKKTLAEVVVEGIQEKKGEEIVLMDLTHIPSAVCDYFVVCQGNSRTHVLSIADSLEEVVQKETGMKPWHSEGHENAEWILVDYGSVVAHIFQPETRSFYNIEALWADAEVTKIDK